MESRIVFPQVCIALGFEDVEALLNHARAEYEAGERFLEFRLDYLASPERGVQAVGKFLERRPDCMILGTCRRRQNQGRFHGSVDEQVRILEAAREAGAKAVDIEVESAENCAERIAHLRSSGAVLIS
ncbi:MAG TPA: type I 3-dehydroquinate dehydratase, partial [Bryobacteraceae bacterium]|nr:type I 3-dehydroquinate dehydratase [Bryobacteraceae bacterium]